MCVRVFDSNTHMCSAHGSQKRMSQDYESITVDAGKQCYILLKSRTLSISQELFANFRIYAIFHFAFLLAFLPFI